MHVKRKLVNITSSWILQLQSFQNFLTIDCRSDLRYIVPRMSPVQACYFIKSPEKKGKSNDSTLNGMNAQISLRKLKSPWIYIFYMRYAFIFIKIVSMIGSSNAKPDNRLLMPFLCFINIHNCILFFNETAVNFNK